MNIAICDDNCECIAYMEEYFSRIKEICKEIEYDTFTSGKDLFDHYESNGNLYDVVILDIEMKPLSGIEVAQKIRDIDTDVCIFFLTSHKEYVYDCFRSSPMNFWIKPVEYDLFKEDIKLAYKRTARSVSYLKIMENRSRIRLKCDDIIYIENKERKSFIYMVSGIHKINKPISELIKDLDNRKFVRVYKSFIINLKYIYEIEENEIILYESNERIPISRTYKKELNDKYITFKEWGNV